MTSVPCPNCEAFSVFFHPLDEGKSMRCPNCGTEFQLLLSENVKALRKRKERRQIKEREQRKRRRELHARWFSRTSAADRGAALCLFVVGLIFGSPLAVGFFHLARFVDCGFVWSVAGSICVLVLVVWCFILRPFFDGLLPDWFFPAFLAAQLIGGAGSLIISTNVIATGMLDVGFSWFESIVGGLILTMWWGLVVVMLVATLTEKLESAWQCLIAPTMCAIGTLPLFYITIFKDVAQQNHERRSEELNDLLQFAEQFAESHPVYTGLAVVGICLCLGIVCLFLGYMSWAADQQKKAFEEKVELRRRAEAEAKRWRERLRA